MRRIIITTLTTWLVAINMWAVKADPTPVVVRQPDGTMLTVVLHGDEHFSYYTTIDDVLLVQQSGHYYIARTDGDGQLHATTQLAHDAFQRQADESRLASLQDRQAFLSSAATLAMQIRKKRNEPIKNNSSLFPHVGEPKALVILAEFSDTPFSITDPKRSFEEYFNYEEALPNHDNSESSNISSVRQYFSNVSFGQYRPSFDVYGPVTLPRPLKTYGGTKANGAGERMDSLFQHACDLMDDQIDFSQYDANDDGSVDLAIIIYAGYSESIGGNSYECIWPKSGKLGIGNYDGKKLSRYAVSAELNGLPDCWPAPPYQRINGIGTLCHELCHTLGLPDFYPTISSSKVDNQGMEYWSLMDSGNYLINGYCPVSLNAWEREALEWIEIPTLDADTTMELLPIDKNGTAYRILNDHDGSQREYFIIENIQNTGHNMAQKGHGMIVYHVEYDPTRFNLSSNSVNNVKGHPRMTIVPADGLLFAQYNIGKTINGKKIANTDFYAQLSGDPFPGTSNQTALNDTMQLVNFQVYKGDKLNKGFDQISEDDNGIIHLTYTTDFAKYASYHNPHRGDVNIDGVVDVTDIMVTINHILGNEVPVFIWQNAEMNGDGVVDVTDVMIIVDDILTTEPDQ